MQKISIEEHKEVHKGLHKALDELVADWILRTGGLPSKCSLTEFMKWSYEQTQYPTPDEFCEKED